MTTTRKTLRAVIGKPNLKREAFQPSTAMVGAGSLVAFQVNPETKKREAVECVTVRTFFNERGSGMQPVRACVWIMSPCGSGVDWLSGSGFANGCGYHKESAAIADAVEAAGVSLFGNPYAPGDQPVNLKKPFHFGGTGDSAYREIFEAIARARGFKGPMLWVSHGL